MSSVDTPESILTDPGVKRATIVSSRGTISVSQCNFSGYARGAPFSAILEFRDDPGRYRYALDVFYALVLSYSQMGPWFRSEKWFNLDAT